MPSALCPGACWDVEEEWLLSDQPGVRSWQFVLLLCAYLLMLLSLIAVKFCQTDTIVFQIYYYHNVKCRVEMFDKDVIMLQV